MNIISVDKEVCAGLRKGHPIHIPNLVTTEQVSVPPDPKTFSMIEQLKIALAKIRLYDLISTYETNKEVLYALFKKETIHTNMSATIFSEKLRSIKECDIIYFYRSEKLSK